MYLYFVISTIYLALIFTVYKGSKQHEFCWTKTPSALQDFESALLKIQTNINEESQEETQEETVEPIEDPIIPTKPSYFNRAIHAVFGKEEYISDDEEVPIDDSGEEYETLTESEIKYRIEADDEYNVLKIKN